MALIRLPAGKCVGTQESPMVLLIELNNIAALQLSLIDQLSRRLSYNGMLCQAWA